MHSASYFGPRYFAPRYWGLASSAAAVARVFRAVVEVRPRFRAIVEVRARYRATITVRNGDAT